MYGSFFKAVIVDDVKCVFKEKSSCVKCLKYSLTISVCRSKNNSNILLFLVYNKVYFFYLINILKYGIFRYKLT